MSHWVPWGRVTPLWSVLGHSASSPASMAGLPGGRRAWVSMGPPLSASGPSLGSIGLGRGAHQVTCCRGEAAPRVITD